MNEEKRLQAKQEFERFQNEELTGSKLKDAEKKASNLKTQMGNFKLLLQMVKDYWNGDYEMDKKSLMIITGAIIYVISPIDVIPDFLPFIGWTDDVAVVAYAIKSLSDVIENYKIFKQSHLLDS